VAEQITEKQAKELAERNPNPKLEREVQTLEVAAGEPKAPEPMTPDKADELQRQVEALRKEKDELVRGNKAKDKALEDAKKRMEESVVAAPDPTDITALIRQEVVKGVESGLERERQRNAPVLEEVAQIKAEKQEAQAISEHGSEVVEKYRDAAKAEQARYPDMPLSAALRLVVPARASKAPATPVEASRSSPPPQSANREELFKAKLSEASKMSTRGDLMRRREAITDAVRLKAPGFFPERGGG
jgi:hypothetical protein